MNDTKFLRFLAILFIINSHLDGYYPIQYFATGGAIGNALFFALSSFGIFLSERNKPKQFTEWYTLRIKRIYPIVWVVLIILTLPYKIYTRALNADNILDFVSFFFYPPFWFLQVLMIYYLIIFPIIKKYRKKYFFCILAFLCALYAFIYLYYIDLSTWSIEDNIVLKLIFYFMIFLFGMYLADIQKEIRYSGFKDWIFLILSLFIIYSHKLMILKNVAVPLQFIQHLLLFPFIYYCLKISRSGLIQDYIMRLRFSSKIVHYISDMTLELYLVHLYVVIVVVKLNILFPINIILFLLVTFLISVLVKFFANHLKLS
jgi:peptidoglycan/LPS O-acetylase OafA/YrhL